MVVKTWSGRGFKVEIKIDSAGKFRAQLDEDADEIVAETLAEIETKLAAQALRRKTEKAVEITILGYTWQKGPRSWDEHQFVAAPGGVTHALYRGKAERTRQLLLTIDGKKVKADSYDIRHGDALARRLTAAEIKRYAALSKTVAAAEADLAEFVKSVQFAESKEVE